MTFKQSATLQHHLRKGIAEAHRTGAMALAADMICISLFKDPYCHAGKVLGELLKDWEIYQIGVQIGREAAKEAAKNLKIAEPGEMHESISAEVDNIYKSTAVINDAPANTGHLLLWILGKPEFISARVLGMYGVTLETTSAKFAQLPENEDFVIDIETLKRFVNKSRSQILPSEQTEDDRGEDDTEDEGGTAAKVKTNKRTESLIGQFAVNLTAQAREGSLDPVVGRSKETERLIQILGRRKKNNPILVGDAGVGKSAIVEGLALRTASRGAAPVLRGKQIYSLDIASLVAGTKYRGQFEERIKALIAELTARKDIILFIDEIHTIVGAGSTQGSLDTANILKPALARGELQCIGATTLAEFRENIETDSALERRFQKITVEPSTAEETFEILENIKERFEKHHSVKYTPEALRACVELTGRYVTDRNFPDKAIDAMDEAGSKMRLANAGEPAIIAELEQKIEQAISDLHKANAGEESDGAASARLRVLSLRAKLEECREQRRADIENNPAVVGVEHIEQIITSMTGIPVEKISQSEQKRLTAIADHLGNRVIGQQTAVGKVARSIQRSRAGLKDPNKPIGVFMFVGPTGVGKTHLTKELSGWLFDRPDSLIRIDMSEYSERHNISRMIGSPPGYVGYGEGGQLSEAVRRQPYAVVLFDEIEKAHPDVFNVMLQIFDEGQLTDGMGRKVDFRNTVIIMTSNVGSRTIAKRPRAVGYDTANKQRMEEVNAADNYRDALTAAFAPEFINRIDDIVVFNTLTREDVRGIVELELNNLRSRTEKLGYKMKISRGAKDRLAALGHEPRYGVRSLKRTILNHVEEPLAQMIVSGRLSSGDTVNIGCRSGNIELILKSA